VSMHESHAPQGGRALPSDSAPTRQWRRDAEPTSVPSTVKSRNRVSSGDCYRTMAPTTDSRCRSLAQRAECSASTSSTRVIKR